MGLIPRDLKAQQDTSLEQKDPFAGPPKLPIKRGPIKNTQNKKKAQPKVEN